MADLIDECSEDAEKCKKLIEVMKSGGSAHQHLRESHLSHLIIKLFDLLSSDISTIGPQIQSLKPWAQEASNLSGMINGDKSSSQQDLIKNIAIGILFKVYSHDISKD